MRSVLLALLLLGALAARAQTPSDSYAALVATASARWSFDTRVNDTSFDEVAKQPMHLYAVATVKGVDGQAIQLDGEVAYAECPEADISRPFPGSQAHSATDFTLSLWVRLNRVDQRGPLIVKQANLHRGFMLLVERNNRLDLQLNAPNDTKSEFAGKAELKPSVWHHVAVTYETTAANRAHVCVYLDGKLDGQLEAAVCPLVTNGEPFQLGTIQWSQTYQKYLYGRLDECLVFPRALSSGDVATLAGLKARVESRANADD